MSALLARRPLLLAAAGGGLLLLAVLPGGLAAAAARAGLLAAALGVAAVLARRWARPPAPGPLRVLAREPLGREAGLLLLEADGRRLLVGFGAGGVRVLTRWAGEERP
ncbi:MAG TPA: flagellar biosynthetic protein FliO [Anaeromyxobacter sp.]|nr:flagellar biosynthetic protein FliO [Anaeromyxobacter sp.]